MCRARLPWRGRRARHYLSHFPATLSSGAPSPADRAPPRRPFPARPPTVRGGIVLGLLGGLAGAALQIAAIFTALPHAAWDRANTAVTVAFSLALVVLAARHGRAPHPRAGLLAPVAAAVLLHAGINLLTYAAATGLFAEQVRQLPFFAKDPVYLRYPTASAYLVPEGNYGALLRLQLFAWVVIASLELALGGAVAAAARASRPSRPSSASGADA